MSLNKLSYYAVSGSFWGRRIQAKKFKFRTVSGNVMIKGFSGEMTGNTVSGLLDLEYNNFTDNLEFSTISGDIKLTLPAEAKFSVNFKSVSGMINSEFPVKQELYGETEHLIEVETVSGNIFIFKK